MCVISINPILAVVHKVSSNKRRIKASFLKTSFVKKSENL